MATQVQPREQYEPNRKVVLVFEGEEHEFKFPKQRRKKGVKRVSAKRATLNAIVNPGRKGFLLLYPTCMVCEQKPSREVHEIARGAAREKCLLFPNLQLATCCECHDLCGDYSKMPPERQLFIRIMFDLKRSVIDLNNLRGRAQTAITMTDVLKWLELET